MIKAISKNELFDYFGVNSNKELLEYIKTNPTDHRVIEIKELLILFGIDLWEEEIEYDYSL